MAPSAFPPPGCPTPDRCEVAGCSDARRRCMAQLPALAPAPIPLPALERPVGGWARAWRRLLRPPAEPPPAGRPGRPMALPQPRRTAPPQPRRTPPTAIPADVPFMLPEEIPMTEPVLPTYPADDAWTQSAPRPPDPAEPAWTPPAPSPRRPTVPAQIVPVSNGFILVINGGPVAIAADDEQLMRITAEWSRGGYSS